MKMQEKFVIQFHMHDISRQISEDKSDVSTWDSRIERSKHCSRVLRDCLWDLSKQRLFSNYSNLVSDNVFKKLRRIFSPAAKSARLLLRTVERHVEGGPTHKSSNQFIESSLTLMQMLWNLFLGFYMAEQILELMHKTKNWSNQFSSLLLSFLIFDFSMISFFEIGNLIVIFCLKMNWNVSIMEREIFSP